MVTITDIDGEAEPRRPALLDLVELALASQPAKPRMQVGPYVLGEKLAEGSTSAIYCILDAKQQPARVLRKMKQHDPPARDVERFRRSLKIAKEELSHPNILEPEVVGEHEGLPYAVMPELDTLERLLACEDWPAARCARVMHQLAAAIAHAHERGIIHCDLKPGNILSEPDPDGGEGKPLIIDFDSARRIDLRDGRAHSTNHGGGATRAYMAPELATGERPTTRVDIYSLGVIFYEMLCTRVPYEGSLAEVLGGLTSAGRVASPRAHKPDIHPYFEAVCLACLEKDPADRYRSAAELVDDLACLLANRRPKRYRAKIQRAKEWARTYPKRSLLAACTLLLAAAGAWQALDPRSGAIAAENAREVRRFASAMERQFEQLSQAATRAARDEAVLSRLAGAGPTNLDPALKEYIRDPASGTEFAGMFVLDPDGRIHAHYPGAPDYIFQRQFCWRDYCRGARELGALLPRTPMAYVTRAFRSETTERLEFGFSVPMPIDGDVRGILLARVSPQDAIRAAGTRGAQERALRGFWQQSRMWSGLIFGNASGLAQSSVLLGPRDRDRLGGETSADLPQGLVYVAHEKLDPRNNLPLAPAYTERLLQAFGKGAPPGAQFASWRGEPVLFKGYQDPLQPGEWSAAALPIWQTGYVALVQSKLDAPPNDAWRQFFGRLVVLFACALLVGSVLLGLVRGGSRPS